MKQNGRQLTPVLKCKLFINLGIICAAEDIIDADVVKIGKKYQRFGRGDALSAFEFGNERLLNTRLHLQGYLRYPFNFSQFFKSVFHSITL